MRILAVMMLVTIFSLALAVWWAVRMLRRLRCFTVRLLDRSRLTVRARLLPGSGRQVAATRLRLHGGLDLTRRVLDDASRRNHPLGDLPRLFRRIEQLAASVDT
jgi:hypothetical protein